MGKNEAKRIAEIITYEMVLEMFERAKDGIKDWESASNVNKGLSKGAAWNILYPGRLDHSIMKGNHKLALINMLREYGDFIKDEYPKPQKPQKEKLEIFHQNPKF